MIWIRIVGTGEVRQIGEEIWVRRLDNGTVAACHRPQAQGVSDGAQTWSLKGLEGYPEAERITMSEYLEALDGADPDPELSAEEALNIIMGGSYETE